MKILEKNLEVRWWSEQNLESTCLSLLVMLFTNFPGSLLFRVWGYFLFGFLYFLVSKNPRLLECSASNSFDLMLDETCQKCKKEVQDISKFLCKTKRSAKTNTTSTIPPPEIITICNEKLCWTEEAPVPTPFVEKVTRKEADIHLFCDKNQVDNPLDIVLSVVSDAIDAFLIPDCKIILPECICITRPILKLVNLLIFLMPISFLFVKTDANPIPLNMKGKNSEYYI